ncbi:MAG: Outer membrane protein assembly factor BamD [Gemmatimonadaceae bacterium]|nr:Outer membrane protein assembly factor BamD [Gemmatimonadaceae bacterium]
MKRRVALLVATAALNSACFATRNDVRILQGDVLAMRGEIARADSARSRQMAGVATQVASLLATLSDSMRVTSARLDRLRGDTRTDLYDIQQQLLQIQELTGQSQRRLQELRAQMEERASQVVAPAPTPTDSTVAAAGATPPAQPTAPGPNQLFQLAQDQMRRGSYATARAGFQELVRLYPTSDLAPDALYWSAEAFAAEGNRTSSDSAYTEVLTRYPRASRAPTALYKLALSLDRQGKRSEARAAMDRVSREYPQSDEADLARDWLRTNR